MRLLSHHPGEPGADFGLGVAQPMARAAIRIAITICLMDHRPMIATPPDRAGAWTVR